MTPFVEARDVGKRFHAGTDAEVRAVDGVSLVAPHGSFLLLTGPSGSGKTTLIALLGTLERPTSGAVLVDGADVAALTEAARSRLRRRFGFAFPGGPMIPALPLWENVTLGLVPLGVGVAARRRIAAEFLDRVGLASKLRARPEELSTGELNRATLARALAVMHEAIFADEPLASLDAAAQRLVVASHVAEPFAFATASCRLEGGRRIDTEGRVTP